MKKAAIIYKTLLLLEILRVLAFPFIKVFVPDNRIGPFKTIYGLIALIAGPILIIWTFHKGWRKIERDYFNIY